MGKISKESCLELGGKLTSDQSTCKIDNQILEIKTPMNDLGTFVSEMDKAMDDTIVETSHCFASVFSFLSIALIVLLIYLLIDQIFL